MAIVAKEHAVFITFLTYVFVSYLGFMSFILWESVLKMKIAFLRKVTVYILV